ncbi:MAG: pyrrolo-quinoline quinone [Planctomycetaceae bacterium]|nr:pyrrolo-quinoline quinone [Planctomycetaceae bacterium]
MRPSLCSLLLLSASAMSQAADWPQWLGPQRDSVWREDGIVSKFPADGLPVKWRATVGLGYSGPAVWDGKVYVLDYERQEGELKNGPGTRTKLEGRERVLCFDAATGDLLWQHAYDRPYSLSYASGPRCTPTVNEGRVYALGAHGDLRCLEANSGKVLWKKDLVNQYNAPTPVWGFAAHPLVDGDLLYCVVGGEGSVAVAFDKRTGKEVWHSLTAREQGYCPPVMIEHAGVKQLVIWHPEAINGLNPKTGEVYWTQELKPSYGMSITTPRKIGDHLFASGIGGVGALLKLNNDKPDAEIEWRGKPKSAVYCCNSTPFAVDGILYGNDCQVGNLMAVRLEDGERLWNTFKPTSGSTRRASHGTAFIVRHEDRFFLFSETGDLILAKLSPSGYEEISRFHVLDPTNECFGRDVVWSHPAFAQKCMFARNDKELVCVGLAGE